LASPSLQEWNAVEEEVRSVLKEYPDVLKLTHGRKVSIVSYISARYMYQEKVYVSCDGHGVFF